MKRKAICVFYCCDKECHGTANYYLLPKKFEICNNYDKDHATIYLLKSLIKMEKLWKISKEKIFMKPKCLKEMMDKRVVQWYD